MKIRATKEHSLQEIKDTLAVFGIKAKLVSDKRGFLVCCESKSVGRAVGLIKWLIENKIPFGDDFAYDPE